MDAGARFAPAATVRTKEVHMRRLMKTGTVTSLVLLLAGCAATMTVSSHAERNLDFARYRSFAWGPADPLPKGDPRLDRNPLFKDRLQGAVEKQLAQRGIALAAGDADLLIHYHANVTHRMDPNQFDRANGYCATVDCVPSPVSYESGTLIIDIVDARSQRLIWRGWAQSDVEDLLRGPDSMTRTIDEAVTRIVRRLPPVK